MVTDRSLRHSLFLRAADPDFRAVGALDRIAALVLATNGAIDVSGTRAQNSSWMPSPVQTADMAADERLAQRLQVWHFFIKRRVQVIYGTLNFMIYNH